MANLHSNSRSELAVKSLKRLLEENIGQSGSVDNDAVAQALLAYANTPCKILGKSPAPMAYGRRLTDFLHRSEKSLRQVPKDLMYADEKELIQLEIWGKMG